MSVEEKVKRCHRNSLFYCVNDLKKFKYRFRLSHLCSGVTDTTTLAGKKWYFPCGWVPIPAPSPSLSVPTIQALGIMPVQRHLLKEPGDETIPPPPEIFLVKRDGSNVWIDLEDHIFPTF